MGEIITGTIKTFGGGSLGIVAPYDNTDRFIRRGYMECRIMLMDSRMISNEQRKKAYALLGEINDYTGELPEYTKRFLKLKFMHKQQKGLADDIFSLADCDMTTAHDFITYLVDFIIAHDIPCKVPLVELCDDIPRFVFTCLKYKKCVICGRKSELHHYDRVGMGNDRNEIVHKGMRAYSLCHKHHSECHTKSQKDWDELYHLKPVVLDDALCKVWKLKSGGQENGV